MASNFFFVTRNVLATKFGDVGDMGEAGNGQFGGDQIEDLWRFQRFLKRKSPPTIGEDERSHFWSLLYKWVETTDSNILGKHIFDDGSVAKDIFFFMSGENLQPDDIWQVSLYSKWMYINGRFFCVLPTKTWPMGSERLEFYAFCPCIFQRLASKEVVIGHCWFFFERPGYFGGWSPRLVVRMVPPHLVSHKARPWMEGGNNNPQPGSLGDENESPYGYDN